MQFFTLIPNMTSKNEKKNEEHDQIVEILESEQKSQKIDQCFQTMANKN